MAKRSQNLIEAFTDLPEDLQNALFAPQTTEAIREISKKYELAIDKMGELADETGLVILGITPPSEYIKNLVGRLGINQEKARAIADEINKRIFQPVRESLKKVHGLGEPPARKVPVKKIPTITPEIAPEDKKPELPPIFAKNMPPSAPPVPKMPVTEAEKVKGELESMLNQGSQPQPYTKGRDPYRETIE